VQPIRVMTSGVANEASGKGTMMRCLICVALVACILATGQPTTAWAETTLRAVMNSDLKVLDPIWSGAYVVRDHGYMIYDTLFATDARGEIKPQMVDKTEVSTLTYPFTLREGCSGTTVNPSRPRTVSHRSSAGPGMPWGKS
jgi:ABC-type transport system substrate-binding protein